MLVAAAPRSQEILRLFAQSAYDYWESERCLHPKGRELKKMSSVVQTWGTHTLSRELAGSCDRNNNDDTTLLGRAAASIRPLQDCDTARGMRYTCDC